jgi:transposase-like protein
MSFPSFTKYLAQTNAHKILQALHKHLEKGGCSWKQNALFSFLLNNNDDPVVKKKIIDIQPETKKKKPEKKEPNIKLSTQNLAFLVWFLIGSGLSYATISFLIGYSKPYVQKLANMIQGWGGLLLSSILYYSGKICVDEKYIKLDGVTQYIFSAVDAVTGLPLFVMYSPSKTAQSWQIFFTLFKKHYGIPSLIITDGCLALQKGRFAVFPNVAHQFCKFHKLKNLIKKFFENVNDNSLLQRLIKKAKQIFSRNTVGARRKALLEIESLIPPCLSGYFNDHLKSTWKHLTKSLTSNAVERWNRKIKMIVSGKYGLKTPETITQLIYCLWFKELIMKGSNLLNPESIIQKINITNICQENIDKFELEHFFDLRCA